MDSEVDSPVYSLMNSVVEFVVDSQVHSDRF